MDLWVVAAAAGAGYLAKYWQNLSGESESSSGNSIPRQSESRNFLQQIRDQTCPFRRLSRKRLGGDVSSGRENGISDEKFDDASTSGSDANFLANGGSSENYNVLLMTSLLPEFQGKERIQENLLEISENNEDFDNSGNVLSEFGRLTRSRSLRSRRSHGVYAKEVNSLESCLTTQLGGGQERAEDYVIGPVPSLLTQTVRPLLVTDGNGTIRRVCINSFGGREHRLNSEGGISFEEISNNKLLETHSSRKVGLVELPRKPEKRLGMGRLRSSNTSSSGGPFHSQGPPNGMLLFFIGITIGMMSAIVANKREVDNLNKMLKQSENLVRDLQEELEMKDMLTVKELAGDYNQSEETKDCSSCNQEPVAFPKELKASAKHNCKEPDNQEVENHELMSKIEAELEAELERLELNMKASTLGKLSDFVELDPDFEAEVIQGDLRVNLVQPWGSQSDSDTDASGTYANHTHTANYAVSPWELSLHLHEVIELRLEARIKELEAALLNSQKKVYSLELQHLISQRDFAYREVGPSSAPGSPIMRNGVCDMDQPFVINFSGEALDACNEAYEDIIRMTDSEQDTPDAVYGCNHVEKEMPSSDKRLVEGQNNGHNDNTETWEERISRSQVSNVVTEDGGDEDDFLMRQIVKKSRQGSSLVFNHS